MIKVIVILFGMAFIIGGIFWNHEVEIALSNWQLWISWVVIWIGVHIFATGENLE